jgi:hypothetical protein
MKTKTILLICLLSGIAFIRLSAQNNQNGTGSSSLRFIWDDYYIDVPVNCNSEDIDRLYGSIKVHAVVHFKNGEWIFNNSKFVGEVTSERGVVYKLQDVWQSEPNSYGRCRIIGNDGSYLILRYYYDFDTDTFTFLKATCPGNE